MSAAFSPPVPAGFVSATAASAPRGSALADWRRTVAAVGGCRPLAIDVLALLAREPAGERGGAALDDRGPDRDRRRGVGAGRALGERGRRAAAEAALAQLDAITVAAARVAVDRQEALDRGQGPRCGERRLHSRNVALLQNARASGGCARWRDQGERKRSQERGAPHAPQGSTARATGKVPGRVARRESSQLATSGRAASYRWASALSPVASNSLTIRPAVKPLRLPVPL